MLETGGDGDLSHAGGLFVLRPSFIYTRQLVSLDLG